MVEENKALVAKSEEAEPNTQELLQDSAQEGKKPETEFRDDTAKKVRTRTVTTTIRDTWWRFLFLGMCCLVLFGSYFCYDNPAPMEAILKKVCERSEFGSV